MRSIPKKFTSKKKLLGSGAFGEVWLVHHKNLDRDFAMKIIKKRKNKSNEEREIKRNRNPEKIGSS
jgi:serine/threonine protein kinase